MPRRFDVLHVADPRFMGGTSTAVTTEMAAAADAGLHVGLLPVHSTVFERPRPWNDRYRRLIADGTITLVNPVDPVATDLLLFQHPAVFRTTPFVMPSIEAGLRLLVAHEPPVHADGRVVYDTAAVLERLQRLAGGAVLVAPVGPAVRRALLAAGVDGARMLAEDYRDVVDPDTFPPVSRRADGGRLVVGRHCRPDPRKWPEGPETIAALFPDRPWIDVRFLGGGPPRERVPHQPDNWTVLPFGAMPVPAFLAGLDVFVDFPGEGWTEAFGLSAAEAMMSGLPVVLPHRMRPIFGDAPCYAEPEDVEGILRHLHENPDERRARGASARRYAMVHFSADEVALRHERLVGDMRRGSPVRTAAPTEPSRRRVLFVTSNGIGLGHVTRTLAIARRLPEDVDAAFFTLSSAAGIIAAEGFPVDAAPSHVAFGLQPESWNEGLQTRLAATLDLFQPNVVVFDGTTPYQGLLELRERRGDLLWCWVRRALWRVDHDEAVLDRAAFFDVVVEPEELCGDEDVGPTVARRTEVLAVPPILLVSPEERLDRAEACAALGLDPRAVNVAVSLGSGRNFAFATLRGAIVDALRGEAGTAVRIIRSPLEQGALPEEQAGLATRVFPFFRYSRAFDAAVLAPGYNSFHEAVLGGLPAVYVPNEAPEMDDQLLRASYAEVTGMGLRLRADELHRVPEIVRTILDEEWRTRVRRHLARFERPDGAAAAATIVADLARSLNMSRPLARLIPRR